MRRFNTQFSAEGISLLNLVMTSSSSIQFKWYLCMYRVATVTSALEKKQTDISVDVNLLTMKQVHRVLRKVFPVPVDLINAA